MSCTCSINSLLLVSLRIHIYAMHVLRKTGSKKICKKNFAVMQRLTIDRIHVHSNFIHVIN